MEERRVDKESGNSNFLVHALFFSLSPCLLVFFFLIPTWRAWRPGGITLTWVNGVRKILKLERSVSSPGEEIVLALTP
jgi:hypothetical protein